MVLLHRIPFTTSYTFLCKVLTSPLCPILSTFFPTKAAYTSSLTLHFNLYISPTHLDPFGIFLLFISILFLPTFILLSSKHFPSHSFILLYTPPLTPHMSLSSFSLHFFIIRFYFFIIVFSDHPCFRLLLLPFFPENNYTLHPQTFPLQFFYIFSHSPLLPIYISPSHVASSISFPTIPLIFRPSPPHTLSFFSNYLLYILLFPLLSYMPLYPPCLLYPFHSFLNVRFYIRLLFCLQHLHLLFPILM